MRRGGREPRRPKAGANPESGAPSGGSGKPGGADGESRP